MSITVSLEALLDYSDHERRKWRDWIAADPARLDIPVQPGGRFPTSGILIEHMFFAERRNLCRLLGATPPESTGLPPADYNRLFEYGELVRADFRRYVTDMTDVQADGLLTLEMIGIGPVTMSRRRLATHVLLHELRHMAQLALASRTAGLEPPGQHDLFFFEEFV